MRGIGWEREHDCMDDTTRLACVEVLEDETAATAAGFLRGGRPPRVRGVLTGNSSRTSRPCTPAACGALGLRHHRTRPYRPRANGKAERFIRTLLAQRYAANYRDSAHRRAALAAGWPSTTGSAG